MVSEWNSFSHLDISIPQNKSVRLKCVISFVNTNLTAISNFSSSHIRLNLRNNTLGLVLTFIGGNFRRTNSGGMTVVIQGHNCGRLRECV